MFPARSILVIDLTPFDRSLELLPSLRALRSAYPNAFITVASSTGTCQLLSAAILINEALELGALRRSQPAQLLFRLGRVARRRPFDMVLDFNPTIATQTVARLLLRARTVTASSPAELLSSLLGGLGIRLNRSTRSSRYDAVLKQIGIVRSDRKLGVIQPKIEDERFEKHLVDAGFEGGEPLVVMHSAAAGEQNEWPAKGFVDLSIRLSNNLGARTVIVDEPGDRTFTELLENQLPQGSIVLQEPNAFQLIAGIARASVTVTDSAGIRTLAQELGAPVIATDKHSTDELYGQLLETIHASRSTSLFGR